MDLDPDLWSLLNEEFLMLGPTKDQAGSPTCCGPRLPTVLCFSGVGEMVLGGSGRGGSCLGDSIIHQLQHLVSGYQFQQASPDS